MSKKYYHPHKGWYLWELVKLLGIGFVISYLFYNSWVGISLLLPIGIWMLKKDKERVCEKQKKQLQEDFKECIIMLSAYLNAGYSLENAFVQTRKEWAKQNVSIGQMDWELERIIHGLNCNETIEGLLTDFGERSEVKEICNFVNLISAAKEYGGNMIHIIRQCAKNMTDRYAVEVEIETMIAAKKLEGKIMLIMPLGIVLYMRLVNVGYMDVLYETMFGRILMTVCLGLMVVASAITDRLIKIHV